MNRSFNIEQSQEEYWSNREKGDRKCEKRCPGDKSIREESTLKNGSPSWDSLPLLHEGMPACLSTKVTSSPPVPCMVLS